VSAVRRLGIVGTGGIAHEMAGAARGSRRVVVTAVASRDEARAAAFAAEYDLERAHAGYERMLADRDLDAVYVATPHRHHAEWAIAALRAGKHVLCEKPMTVNAAEAERVIQAARESGTCLMEAYAYLFHPQTHALQRLLEEQRVGEVRGIAVTFSFAADDADVDRLTDSRLAGGGILDVGCYCVSMSQLVTAGGEPTAVVGAAALDPVQHVDLHAAAVLTYPGPVIAQIACAVALDQRHEVRVSGTHGEIVIDQPCWIPEARDSDTTIRIHRGDAVETITVPSEGHIFALELDGFARLIAEGPAAWEASWARSLATMRTLDRWRAAVGVRYDWA
jgi:predicted dehydrogenase